MGANQIGFPYLNFDGAKLCNAIFILVYKCAVLQMFKECIKFTAASKMYVKNEFKTERLVYNTTRNKWTSIKTWQKVHVCSIKTPALQLFETS